MDCIAIQSLGHDTALGRGVGRVAGREGRAGKSWGAQAGARAWCAGRRWGAQQARRHGAGSAGRRARGVRATDERQQAQVRGKGAGQGWLGGLGALLVNGLCTWCTQPVFGPV